MTRAELLSFLRGHRYAVQATVGAHGPQAATVGFAVADDLQFVFDTLGTSRKFHNLQRSPAIALVISDDHHTAQIEGVARQLLGPELDWALPVYDRAFPDGPSRRAWPDLVYVGVQPTWIRYSDFVTDRIVERPFEQWS
ncbi:MAG: pyridoxamine 5'-phosphate oxidase family protein [Myxococcota bacterium]